MADITEQAAKYGDTDNTLLLKMAVGIQELAGGTGGALTDAQLRASPVPTKIDQTTPGTTNGVFDKTSGTLSIFAKTAGQTETIPVGAFDIGVLFLTGTGTISGVDWPVGVPFNIKARTAATIAVVCGSPGTARVEYLT